MYVIVARTCSGCGDKAAIMLLDKEPTHDDKLKVSDHLGGGYCIVVSTSEIKSTDTVIDLEND